MSLYPIPVSFFSSVSVLSAVTIGENAVEHSQRPEVAVGIKPTDDDVQIYVQDTGPGLPESEQAVLRGESETPLAHGSGLDLWVSYWVVDDHGGSIDTTVTDAGTRITITLPRPTTGPDVTDQATLKRELQREQDRFKAVFEAASDASVIVDNDGHAINLNQRAATLFGRTKTELLGRSLGAFTPQRFDFETAWEEFTDSEPMTALFPLVQSDSTERTVEFDATRNVIPNQHLVRIREMTERQHRERELRRQTERLAETGGWEYDLTTETILWTEGTRRIHEVPAEYEPTIDGAIEFYHPDDRPKMRAAVDKTIEDGTRYQLELRLQTANGDEKWVETTGEPVKTDGKITAVRGAIREITDRNY